MRKVDDGGGKRGGNRQRMMFIVATNIVAGQTPECRPIGTATARANIDNRIDIYVKRTSMTNRLANRPKN